MAYDEAVARQVRRHFEKNPAVTERKMFGGIAFMLNGNMCCGVINRDLVLRLGNEQAAEALELPETRPMDFTGKPIKSMIYVSPAGFQTDQQLEAWIQRAVTFAKSLPAK